MTIFTGLLCENSCPEWENTFRTRPAIFLGKVRRLEKKLFMCRSCRTAFPHYECQNVLSWLNDKCRKSCPSPPRIWRPGVGMLMLPPDTQKNVSENATLASSLRICDLWFAKSAAISQSANIAILASHNLLTLICNVTQADCQPENEIIFWIFVSSSVFMIHTRFFKSLSIDRNCSAHRPSVDNYYCNILRI